MAMELASEDGVQWRVVLAERQSAVIFSVAPSIWPRALSTHTRRNRIHEMTSLAVHELVPSS